MSLVDRQGDGACYVVTSDSCDLFFFFFNDTATTEIYTLSLHDALPIWSRAARGAGQGSDPPRLSPARLGGDRKSTRLNSSHSQISYAVFCLKKKKDTAAARGSSR